MACRIWIDAETTGLDPTAGFMLELAVVATDSEAPEYHEVASQSWVIRPEPHTIFDMHQTVRDMHTNSGLLDELHRPHAVAIADAERDLLKFFAYFGNPIPGREPIAGSSPHFDAAWLAVHMPTARKYFNHRTFDASNLKRFALDHGVVWPADDGEGSGGVAHRALADVRYSIQTARTVARLLAAR